MLRKLESEHHANCATRKGKGSFIQWKQAVAFLKVSKVTEFAADTDDVGDETHNAHPDVIPKIGCTHFVKEIIEFDVPANHTDSGDGVGSKTQSGLASDRYSEKQTALNGCHPAYGPQAVGPKDIGGVSNVELPAEDAIYHASNA